jgi:adenylosuccinate synthase
MPVSVVVGGQFGSEGKGKVALFLARARRARVVVRIGGSNSGHTAVAANGEPVILRQLPTAALLPDVLCVIGPGSYVDADLLLGEIDRLGLDADRLALDSHAVLITEEDRLAEASGPLRGRIGSTCSGTGAAVEKRIARRGVTDLVASCRRLAPFVRDTVPLLRDSLRAGERVIVEGTQGLGLSVLHSPHFPYVTSRDTSAAGAVAEAGLSPFDIDEISLVLRAHPIRVAGNSGPFDAEEITWEDVAREGGHHRLGEFTSVTGRLRRVARFDPQLVRRAIDVNQPSLIVLNHLDYVDAASSPDRLSPRSAQFVEDVSAAINRSIDLIGLGPESLIAPVGSSAPWAAGRELWPDG